ncbi:MAG TPA: DEAD/DEAH box helicase, partial [Cryptosporangiaceae bacterium]|nr:DEAD/DEAH box helicase [Cryptosporangiaceae bacterium]
MLTAILPTLDDVPTTPSFADLGLPAPMVAALRRHGLTAPFPIQTATIPDVLAGRDVLGRGATGSGKTLAFGLPMLVRLSGGRSHPKRPHGLILVPTRELAMQVTDALSPAADALGLKVRPIVGGMAMGKQVDQLRRGLDLVVATPGRLEDHLRQGTCDLSAVETTTLDEADQMADMGFLPVVRALLNQTAPNGQRLLFSATLDGDVDKLVRQYLTDPVKHSLSPVTAAVDTMDHHFLRVSHTDKVQIAGALAALGRRVLLFVRTKHGADRLVTQLERVGVTSRALHGGKTQSQRNRVLADFKTGGLRVLVATDVAARGVHVDAIDIVLHVDPPADPKAYLHRAGRTARAGESGVVVTLVAPYSEKDSKRLARDAGIAPLWSSVLAGDALPESIRAVVPVAPPQVLRPLAERRPERTGSPRGFE